VVLHHAARSAAGAAGVDDAGEVGALGLARHALLDRGLVALSRHHVAPLVDLRGIAGLAGPDVLDFDDVPAVRFEQHRGDEAPASFWVETITALAPEFPRTCWWSRVVLVV
jgi:hypothetical protein